MRACINTHQKQKTYIVTSDFIEQLPYNIMVSVVAKSPGGPKSVFVKVFVKNNNILFGQLIFHSTQLVHSNLNSHNNQ